MAIPESLRALPTSQDELLALIDIALPDGCSSRTLGIFPNPQVEFQRFVAHTLASLCSAPEIDWDAYLKEYPDVMSARIDPAGHFARSGLWEGRKLPVRRELQLELERKRNAATKISIIVTFQSSSIFLKNLFGALLSQTLDNVEVIVADNLCAHPSLPRVSEAARMMPSVTIVGQYGRQGLHSARKACVQIANGKYILFMDGADLITPDACKLAYEAAERGFDIVCFNARIIGARHESDSDAFRLISQTNLGAPQTCRGYEIVDKIFVHNEISAYLWNKIYKADLCKAAFLETGDQFMEQEADLCETLALASRARNLCKIDNVLYLRRFPDRGQSLPAGKDAAPGEETRRAWPAIRSWLERTGRNDCMRAFKERLLDRETANWLNLSSPGEITECLNNMAADFGAADLVAHIATNYFRKWQRVSAVFRNYMPVLSPLNHTPLNIGIVFGVFGNGGTEKVIRQMASLFIEAGHKVTLFLERPCDNDINLPEGLRIVYVPLDWYHEKHVRNNIYAFAAALGQESVDVIFCEACWSEALLWQTMLFRLMKIPVIMHNHMAFFDRLLWKDSRYRLQDHDSVLRCADKVICLSRYSELYNHTLGIDAVCIANPVEIESIKPGDFESRRNSIVILGRIGDVTKRLPDALRTVAEIARELPEIMATFVGELGSGAEREQFCKLARELGIESNVQITGWTTRPLPIVANAAVLLSCAYQESFGLAICEAQSLGLPCVIYDLPIMPAEDNPSIIRVPHGDYVSAAREIIDLLEDRSRWARLSEVAKANARKFSPRLFQQRITKLLASLGKQSDLPHYSAEDYRVLLRVLGFYAGDLPPWETEGQ